MSSPFQTYKDFSEAEGAIYSFGNNPSIIGILTVVSALIFVYFIYATYTIKRVDSVKNPLVLSLLILSSAVSLAGQVFYANVHQEATKPGESRVAGPVSRSGWQPLALLGMVGMGSTGRRWKARSRRRR
jgi:uncharacterized membrane protein YkvI